MRSALGGLLALTVVFFVLFIFFGAYFGIIHSSLSGEERLAFYRYGSFGVLGAHALGIILGVFFIVRSGKEFQEITGYSLDTSE